MAKFQLPDPYVGDLPPALPKELQEPFAGIQRNLEAIKLYLDELGDVQPLDTDLTAIAALNTASYGRSLLTAVDAAAARTTLDAQQLDSDLTAIAAVNTAAFGRGLLAETSAANARTTLGTVAKPTGYSQRGSPAFATDYTPSATAITNVIATVRITCDSTGDDGEIKVRIGGSGGSGGSLIEVMRNRHVDPSASPESLVEIPVSFFVPANQTYRLETTTNAATPTFTFVSAWEMVF